MPPKLAQVLCNTTSSKVVCDPFCGTGLILQEALLLGREAVGYDLSEKMVKASRRNLDWLSREVNGRIGTWSVEISDARHAEIPSSCAVVSEGYLGPNLGRTPTPAELGKLKRELHNLYIQTLSAIARRLGKDGEVALCVPVWRSGRGWEEIDLVDELPRLGYSLKGFQHVRTPLLYYREGQFVGRQILLLRKND
jgi:tRNA G10  N-methylase Trm11